jgi:hypothetical protein
MFSHVISFKPLLVGMSFAPRLLNHRPDRARAFKPHLVSMSVATILKGVTLVSNYSFKPPLVSMGTTVQQSKTPDNQGL